VLDNYGTHKYPEVRKWLPRPENQRIRLRLTPASCSWLNMVKIFFGIITRQAIRCGTFCTTKELTTAIGAFNKRCQPFTWTKRGRLTLHQNHTVKQLTPRDTGA
jgi:hypothetical protein